MLCIRRCRERGIIFPLLNTAMVSTVRLKGQIRTHGVDEKCEVYVTTESQLTTQKIIALKGRVCALFKEHKMNDDRMILRQKSSHKPRFLLRCADVTDLLLNRTNSFLNQKKGNSIFYMSLFYIKRTKKKF